MLPMTQANLPISRRDLLRQASCGFGYLALAGLCGNAKAAPKCPLAAIAPHHIPRAKRVIFLFMQGGPSQVDTFDFKPRLSSDNGKQVEFDVARTRQITPERVFQSPWSFKQYGQCGQWVSELFPHVARHVDDLCVIRSMHTEGVAHGPATLFLHTGATNLILKDAETGELSNLAASGVFIFIGFTPNSGLVKGHYEHDANGYVITDQNMMTSTPGLFAAGDLRVQLTRQITTAVGDATTAAIAVEKYLTERSEAKAAVGTA